MAFKIGLGPWRLFYRIHPVGGMGEENNAT